MVTFPQLGHWNFMPFSPGVIFFPHEIQEGILLSLLSCRYLIYLKVKEALELPESQSPQASREDF